MLLLLESTRIVPVKSIWISTLLSKWVMMNVLTLSSLYGVLTEPYNGIHRSLRLHISLCSVAVLSVINWLIMQYHLVFISIIHYNYSSNHYSYGYYN